MEQNPVEQPAQNPVDFAGLSSVAAKEYLFGLLSTLKLTEKQAAGLDADFTKWNSRVELARSKGTEDLAQEAEKELERIKAKQQQLTAEISELNLQIEETRRQLPLLAARERSINPDLLEQELLIASGRMPGAEEKARSERTFDKLEAEAAAEAALAELKTKMAEQK
jgi:phage shock protein A